MIMLKPHVWEKSDSPVKCKNALGQSNYRIFKLQYLKNYWSYNVDFLHAGLYLLMLQIEWGQACPKTLLKTFNISKTIGVIKLIFCMQVYIY